MMSDSDNMENVQERYLFIKSPVNNMHYIK